MDIPLIHSIFISFFNVVNINFHFPRSLVETVGSGETGSIERKIVEGKQWIIIFNLLSCGRVLTQDGNWKRDIGIKHAEERSQKAKLCISNGLFCGFSILSQSKFLNCLNRVHSKNWNTDWPWISHTLSIWQSSLNPLPKTLLSCSPLLGTQTLLHEWFERLKTQDGYCYCLREMKLRVS